MKLSFAHTIITTCDLARAKAFYIDCLGIPISKDFGVCFTLQGDALMVHDGTAFSVNIFKEKRVEYQQLQGKANLNLYFETDNLEEALSRVGAAGFRLLHPIEMQSWNQRVFRVYDPDGHIVEVGETLWLKL